MTKQLRISDSLSLPLDFVTSTQVILAQKGKGKTHTATVEAEELLEAGQQIIVVDPTDAWSGLRSSKDGKRAGYPIAVFGGDHGDVKLEADAGVAIAEAVVGERFSCVLCTENLTTGGELRFVGDFLETLYRKNREAVHLFVDEADMFAPQKPFGGEMKTLGAMQNVVRRGRKKGIGCSMITQRSSVLNKDVLSQADMLVALGCSHPRDLDAIGEWVKRHADPALARTMMESLPSLPRGEAWVWNPAADIFKRVTIRDRRTFDSGATPKAGEKARVAKVLAPIDIARLGTAIADTVARQRADDPKVLRSELAKLQLEIKHANLRLEAERGKYERMTKLAHEEGQRAAKPTKMVDPKKLEHVFNNAERWSEGLRIILAKVDDHQRKFHELYGKFTTELAHVSTLLHQPTIAIKSLDGQKTKLVGIEPSLVPDAMTLARQRLPRMFDSVGDRAASSRDDKPPSGAVRKILTALAQHGKPLSNSQIGVFADVSTKGGSYATWMSTARTRGWIVSAGGGHEITEEGLQALGDFEPLPSGASLRQHWLREMGGAAGRILEALFTAYPNHLTNEQIAEQANVATTGGSYATWLSSLRTRDLITSNRGSHRASPELFQ